MVVAVELAAVASDCMDTFPVVVEEEAVALRVACHRSCTWMAFSLPAWEVVAAVGLVFRF